MASKLGPNIVTNGLVFAVDAAASRSYPGSGTTLYDLSGNGYDFTSSVPCTFTSGVNSVPCLDFTSGNQERLDSIKLSPFSGDGFPITVSAVINENARSSYKTILSQHEQDTTDSMCFCSLQGKMGTDHWSPGGRRLATAVPTNEVHMITWTIEEWEQHQTTEHKIYVDGVAQTTESYSVDTVGSLVQDYFRIGNWHFTRADMSFDGQIYSVSCYDRALSAAEVAQNYNAVKKRFNI